MPRKKTSVYLSDEDRERLARLSERKGESQAWVLREALLAYDAGQPDRNYAMFEVADGRPRAARPDPADLQRYNDELDRLMAEGLQREYEEQLDDALHAMAARDSGG